MQHLQASKLCVDAVDLMQRIPRAESQGKFTNAHSLQLHIVAAMLSST